MTTRTDPEQYQMLYEELPAICLMLDETFNILEVNRYGLSYLGYEYQDLVNHSFETICIASERDFIFQKFQQCLKNPASSHRWECLCRRKDNSHFWVRDTVRVVQNKEQKRRLLIISEDITETRYLINELERQGSIDSLTGLNNRRKFDRHLEELMISAQSEDSIHILLYIDLDKFKVVNDSGGHLCGDEMLRQVAMLLRSLIRNNDVLARLGGDEFGLILEYCTVDEALAVGEKIINALERFNFIWNEMSFTIGASIGAVIIDGSECKAQNILHFADTACFTAKDKGRNRIQMYDMGDKDMEKRGGIQKWVGKIQNAIETNQFVLFRQKITSISTMRDNSEKYEILLRMRKSNGELILPGSFIPAAEYYAISPRIDRWVTETVINRYAEFSKGKDITYFVNLSGLTLSDDRFIHDMSLHIKNAIENGLKICFEITETAAIRNLTDAMKFMEYFRTLGCQFALDDFGSGFSSFGYLKTLPVDYIKIDGAFIKNMINEPLDLAVVRAINEVAEVFGKRTIAEYVESAEILNVIKGLGIDSAQGYHFDHPEPMSEKDQ